MLRRRRPDREPHPTLTGVSRGATSGYVRKIGTFDVAEVVSLFCAAELTAYYESADYRFTAQRVGHLRQS